MNASLTLDSAGRVVLPAAVRKALGLKPGSRLILSVEGPVVTLTPMREAIRRAQAMLAPYRPKDGTLMSDALIAERREEYRREMEDIREAKPASRAGRSAATPQRKRRGPRGA